MRPTTQEYAPFYGGYVDQVKEEAPVPALENSLEEARQFLSSLPAEKAESRYAEGKWSVKEVIQHMIDTERVMAYRALRFARNDNTELPGYDENAWVASLDLSRRSLHELGEELLELRQSTLSLFHSFPESVYSNAGIASGQPASVRALAYIIAGHQRHHFNILKERYF